MIYKEQQRYKVFHLFLIQNLYIYLGIECLRFLKANKFYSIQTPSRLVLQDDQIVLGCRLLFPNVYHLIQQ